jgi:hypothetical protein
MEFDHFGLSVKDLTTRNVIARSNSTDLLYTLCLLSSTTSSRTSPCAMSTIDVPHILAAVATSTWHRRLGHPGPDALSSLSRSSFISCTSTTYDFCHACQLSKHTRLPFSSSSSCAEKAFDLLYLDLWTSPIISVSGLKYYLVILDDFTHYLWTFLLKQKSDTFTTLSNFFSYVTTQFSCTVKAIQRDNGREFDNSSTWTFLLSKGAQLRISRPYTSPQNSKAECIIHTINNVIRTLLIQASLLRRYWAEELHTAVYLLNNLPTKTIYAACPHVTLFGSTPSYEHLRFFGCACYPNLATTAPHKLTPRSTRCVFLGYSTDHKGYRYLDLSTNRLIISRHVVFDEDSFPLAASPNLTDLDFLFESSSTISTIWTRLPLAGSTTMAVGQPTLVVPSGFEPLVAPLPTPAVPLGFLPHAASMTPVVPHVVQSPPAAPGVATPTPIMPQAALGSPTVPCVASAPPAATDGPPPHEWSSSPIIYVKCPRQPTLTAPMGPASTPPDRRPPTAIPVTPPVNPHRMVTRAKAGFLVLPNHLVLAASMSPLTPSLILTSVCAALANPNWRVAMEDEYGALMSNGTWELVAQPRGSNVITGKWVFTHKLHADGSFDRYKARWVLRDFTQRMGSTTMRLSTWL